MACVQKSIKVRVRCFVEPEANPAWQVEYSTDNGDTWTPADVESGGQFLPCDPLEFDATINAAFFDCLGDVVLTIREG